MSKRAKTSGWGKTSKRNRILAAALGFVATAGAFAAFAQSEAPREWKNYRGKTVVTGVIDLSKTVEGFPSDAEKPSSVWFRASDGTAFSYRYALLSADDKKAVDVALDLDAGPGPDPGERALAVVPKNCVRRAVLVGVNDYAEFSDLRFAGADVELVRERLVELGFALENIVALTTENGRSNSAFAPTQRNIERELRRILDASGPEDMVFIMFTGHGLQTDDFGGYAPYVGFAPSDAVATNDETVVDFGTTISLSKLFDDLNACKAKFKWALIDACRENLSEGKKSLDDSKRLRPLDAPAGVIVLQSCAAKEFSYEDEEFGHGLFTHYFTESLGSVGDANEDGVVTMTEAFSRAQALVRKRTNGAGYDRVQTPYCRGDFADFPLADVKTAEAKKRWSAAVEAREKGDYATALEEIDAALALMPEKPEYATEKKTIEDLKRQADEASTRREAEELAANAWTAYNKDKTSETNVGEAIRLMKEALEKCENASNRNALGIFEETLAAILDNKAEAEKLLAEAQAAFERKDYATAKSKCEASSRLVSSPDARALSAKIEDALASNLFDASFASAQEFTSLKQIAEFENGKYIDAYNIQGAYYEEAKNRGYHVIARGADKFDVVGYQDGLPGAGWDRSKARFFGTGELVDGKLVVTAQKMDIPRYEEDREIVFTDEQKATKLIGTMEGDKFFLEFRGKSELQRVVLESPTLGMKAPEGATVIFDGTNLDNFEPGAKMNEETKALWSEARVKPFEKKPYTLHIEFMTSFMPNQAGQARANSGVCIGEAYECQVLDSFGLEGENNECGGFYQFAKPIVNMAAPPLTWQTYDIDYTPAKFEDGKKVANARVTVKHNGVLIHDDVELPRNTPGCKGEADEARGLYLQGHGNKVQYRNIWVQYKD